jgi:hypothetical protein
MFDHQRLKLNLTRCDLVHGPIVILHHLESFQSAEQHESRLRFPLYTHTTRQRTHPKQGRRPVIPVVPSSCE